MISFPILPVTGTNHSTQHWAPHGVFGPIGTSRSEEGNAGNRLQDDRGCRVIVRDKKRG